MRIILFFFYASILLSLTTTYAYNSPKFTHDLVKNNYKLVPYFAKPFIKKNKLSAYEREELMQEGYIGLIFACRKYDDAYGVALSTYSRYWINSYMNAYLRNKHRTRRPLELDTERYIAPSSDVIVDIVDINLIISSLEPWQRFVVRKRFFDKVTIKQLATECGVSRNTMSKYLTQIKNKIRGGIARQSSHPRTPTSGP